MLIEIKSRMLLPMKKADSEEEVEDPRAELVRRLLEYERMKLAAQELDQIPQQGRDFQIAHGYADTVPGKANLTMCSNWVAESFDCLAMTLEMPFKDTADSPRPQEGWSAPRSRR